MQEEKEMYVIKRDGRKEAVKFDKITARINKLCYNLNTQYVDAVKVAMKVINGMYPGISTSALDNLAAQEAAAMSIVHPDYALLASESPYLTSTGHRKSFSKTIDALYHYKDPKTGEHASLIAQDVWEVIMTNAELLDSTLIYDRDYNFDFSDLKPSKSLIC